MCQTGGFILTRIHEEKMCAELAAAAAAAANYLKGRI